MSLYVWGTGCAAGELIERGFEPPVPLWETGMLSSVFS